MGRIVASSSLKELLARLCAILGLSLLADNTASLPGCSLSCYRTLPVELRAAASACSVPQLVLQSLMQLAALRAVGDAAISDTTFGDNYNRKFGNPLCSRRRFAPSVMLQSLRPHVVLRAASSSAILHAAGGAADSACQWVGSTGARRPYSVLRPAVPFHGHSPLQGRPL